MLQWKYQNSAAMGLVLVALVFVLPGAPCTVSAAQTNSARLTANGRLYIPPELPDAGATYSFAGTDQTLPTALKYFALNIGVSLVMDPSVPDVGNSDEQTGLSRLDYINYLAEKFRLVWYFDGATLYVDTTDHVEQKVFSLQKADGERVLSILQNLDLFQPKFIFSYDLQSKVLTVSGPPSYVGLVENTVKAVDVADGRSTVVYRGATARTGFAGAMSSAPGMTSPATTGLAGNLETATQPIAPLTLGGQ
ncbi:secretin N-terminal domain-containing protein [Martelella sp. HB161492]|uniref:secretin N-terminal domain-containing protein n=1 Tax=Martelella sp. HB161492 TaxID=2720726 RepID=UPI00159001CC|nr:secretin N-terminal domain-containing protein [Martelella sp. HB161492]